MAKIIGVQFQKNGKLYYFDTNGFEVRPGDYVIVDTIRGADIGEVVLGARETPEEQEGESSFKKVIRLATEKDVQHSCENRIKEKEAFSICQNKIAEHKLEMKLVSVEYAFDNSKILFYFTANGRVDFRSLVKDLASIFKMRIELRQIGVRDEARMLGGLGPCGRPICCGAFLDQFQPVSIKMAKEQNLSLNPTKISGVCGRLMCCLKYEQDHYEQTRKRMPKVGKEVATPDGIGTVSDLNIVKETVFVRLTNGDTSEIKEFSLESIQKSVDAADGTSISSGNPVRKKATEAVSSNSVTQTDNDGEPVIPEAKENHHNRSNNDDLNKNHRGNKRKNNALGQPVKRENPKRNASADSQTGSGEPRETSDKPEMNQKPGQKAVSPWADAVQKAIEAAGQEK